MYCSKCKTQLAPNTLFCSKCGQAISKTSEKFTPAGGVANQTAISSPVVVVSHSVLGTKFLKFWNYFSLPVGGVLGLLMSIALPDLAIIMLPLAILQFIVAYGLHYRRLWAWQWNWVLVVITYIGTIIPIRTPGSHGGHIDLIAQCVVRSVVGGLIWMWPNYVYWNKRHILFSDEHSYSKKLDKDAIMERNFREADARAVEETRRRADYSAPKKTQPNEEFIALLKSAVNENRLKTIPNEDLLEICKRARSIDVSSKKLDIELSTTINILLEEIKKRGFNKEYHHEIKHPNISTVFNKQEQLVRKRETTDKDALNVRTSKCELCRSLFPSADIDIFKGKVVCPSCFKANNTVAIKY